MKESLEDIRFTNREKQVLKLTAEGFSCKETAEKLGIAETTVITYKKRLKEKYQVKNIIELVYKSTREGLI